MTNAGASSRYSSGRGRSRGLGPFACSPSASQASSARRSALGVVVVRVRVLRRVAGVLGVRDARRCRPKRRDVRDLRPCPRRSRPRRRARGGRSCAGTRARRLPRAARRPRATRAARTATASARATSVSRKRDVASLRGSVEPGRRNAVHPQRDAHPAHPAPRARNRRPPAARWPAGCRAGSAARARRARACARDRRRPQRLGAGEGAVVALACELVAVVLRAFGDLGRPRVVGVPREPVVPGSIAPAARARSRRESCAR